MPGNDPGTRFRVEVHLHGTVLGEEFTHALKLGEAGVSPTSEISTADARDIALIFANFATDDVIWDSYAVRYGEDAQLSGYQNFTAPVIGNLAHDVGVQSYKSLRLSITGNGLPGSFDPTNPDAIGKAKTQWPVGRSFAASQAGVKRLYANAVPEVAALVQEINNFETAGGETFTNRFGQRVTWHNWINVQFNAGLQKRRGS